MYHWESRLNDWLRCLLLWWIQSTVDSWFVLLWSDLADGQRKGKSQNTKWVIQMVLSQAVWHFSLAWTVLDTDDVKQFRLGDSRGHQSHQVTDCTSSSFRVIAVQIETFRSVVKNIKSLTIFTLPAPFTRFTPSNCKHPRAGAWKSGSLMGLHCLVGVFYASG